MNDISVIMAIADCIAPILFVFIYGELKKFFNQGCKGYESVVSGAIICLVAGFAKVLWKFLYALGICDYEILSTMFFPLTSVGYWLLGVGINVALSKKAKSTPTSLNEVAPVVPVCTSKMPFLLGVVTGSLVLYTGLIRMSLSVKKKKPIIFIVLSLIFLFANSVTSSKFDNSGIMHWIAQSINYLNFGCLLIAMKQINKAKAEPV